MAVRSSCRSVGQRCARGRWILLSAFLLLAVTTEAAAAGRGRHRQAGPRARTGAPNSFVKSYRLDSELTTRSGRNSGTSRVIIELQPGAELPPEFARYAARRNAKLKILNGEVVELPNGLIRRLAAYPSVFRIHHDRPIEKHNYRTSLATGTRVVQQTLGLTGAGIGVAVIDSGITNWHDDLTNQSSTLYPFGNQRVSAFVDFVNGRTTPYDDDGHGTHVAGIIAGNGFDSNGQKAGAAPDASIVALKVLDAQGNGTVSNIIAALDWVLANHEKYNIRVVNMSVGAAVNESFWTDPLTLATKRVVDAGVVVVSAAGNLGKNAAGQTQYGAISAPANAPWVLTVGASSTNGTPGRGDDAIAGFSSRGPTYIDWAAKPDLVAPGAGSVSLSDPASTFYATKPSALLPGSISTSYLPYLSLSGTSMAAPVVSGVVALMLQANPSLTPNAVKALLQYTAQEYSGYNPLTQGAGFLNAIGAVRLARFYATAKPGDTLPLQGMWGKKILWGNHLLSNGVIDPGANAYSAGTTWGVAKTDDGDNIVWGTTLTGDDNIVWGTSFSGDDNIVWGTSFDGDNIVWGTSFTGDDNIVWGTDCGGADCDNIVWGTSFDGDNIVWGTASPDDNIVWGTRFDGDNIVWGTSFTGDDNIVWGTSFTGDDNIVWGTSFTGDDNIVWGTSFTGDDNIVWGTSFTGDDNIVWGTAGSLSTVWTVSADGTEKVELHGRGVFDRFGDQRLLDMIAYVPPPPPPPRPAPVTSIWKKFTRPAFGWGR